MESVRVVAPTGSARVVSSPSAIVLALSAAIRKLPPVVVRVLVLADVFLSLFPPYAWFQMWRWTGRALSVRESIDLYPRALRFAIQHMRHSGGDTGLFAVDWHSAPVRRCERPERADYQPKGSCGTCTNCCTTHWLPEAERTKCPYLGERGCTAYAGIYWDYFNCGRYPAKPASVASYSCPRFEGILARAPKLLPLAAPAPVEEEKTAA